MRAPDNGRDAIKTRYNQVIRYEMYREARRFSDFIECYTINQFRNYGGQLYTHLSTIKK